MCFIWGLLSDGPCRGSRWPFIHIGAVITVRTFNPYAQVDSVVTFVKLVMCVLLRQMPLYTNIPGRMAVYWLSNIGVGPSPNMSRRELQLTVVSGWCWSTHP